MDITALAERLSADGYIGAFARCASGRIEVTSGHRAHYVLSAYPMGDWLLARQDAVRCLASFENDTFELCARPQPEPIALLRSGEVAHLSRPEDMAALGGLLHHGLAPGAYAEALARTQAPGLRQDWGARILGGDDDLPPELAGRRLPRVEAPRASRGGGRVNLTFCAARLRFTGGWRPTPLRVDQWRVTAPAGAPATWEVTPVCESESA